MRDDDFQEKNKFTSLEDPLLLQKGSFKQLS